MPPVPIGATRERVFHFVRERLLAGDPPTVRDVQNVFGFRTPQTARYHLEKLVRGACSPLAERHGAIVCWNRSTSRVLFSGCPCWAGCKRDT